MKQKRFQEIAQLYHAAMELPESERTRFLETCKDDDIRQEVLSLLQNEDKAKSFLEEPALEVASRLKSKERPSLLGRQLGAYRVISELGKGGMGEVYQAKDQRLGRDVAIKVLPEEFAMDADRVARFEREAKLLASLNNPNIAAIHGLEESNGTRFLVLELVEGDTLADRIKAGPIAVEESLKLALQITEALEAAHEKGVIHRDLKPANIKVTPEGKVKVLDFGLAKALAGDQEEMILSESPTKSTAATQKGVVLGTAAYMSPEQAKGKDVDKRADIWAFGAVLYEMLTGRAAFSGEDVSDIFAAVIRAEPDWSILPPNLHWRLRELLERCLEKVAKDRYSGISDARVDIQKVLADPSGVLVQPGATIEPRTRMRSMLPWAAATLILIIIAGVVGWNLRTPEPHQIIHFDYALPEGQEFVRSIGQYQEKQLVAVSADSTKIVYVANDQLYLKNSDELTARPIQGTDEDPDNPFFSPDGQWVGYFAGTQLNKIEIGGGEPRKLCDVSSALYGSTWEADGTIVFGTLKGIMRVSSNGGTSEMLVETKEGELIYGPSVLPGGEWLLFTTTNATGPNRWDEAQIVVESLKTQERRLLVSGGSGARYVPTGHLVYALGDDLLAVAFDTDSLETTGETIPIIQGVRRPKIPAVSAGNADYDFSDGGMLAYVAGSAVALKRTLVWVDQNGNEEPLEVPPNAYLNPRISPDGTMVALGIETGGNSDIWILDLARGSMTKLTLDEAEDAFPLWTPDGKRIAFFSGREGTVGIYWKSADGTGEAEQLASGEVTGMYPASWSRNGKTLLFEDFTRSDAGIDIAGLSMEGDRKWKPLIYGRSFESHPQVSPNGQRIAYTSDESGQYEIYMRPFPEVDKGRLKISTSGGQEPRWSPDGRELFYRSGDAMMVVAVETGPTLKAKVPETLFKDIYFYYISHQWDIHPSGKRFLMIKESAADSTEGTTRDKINIVVNWFEELKELVPVP